VIVHGLLHLIGYDDHTPEEEKQIHQKEDYYLGLRNFV
jgi:ssRNA-specific RNase YbeY (16S rRNA maturation enzyme)